MFGRIFEQVVFGCIRWQLRIDCDASATAAGFGAKCIMPNA